MYNPDDPSARTVLGAVLAVFCWNLCTTGSDQVAIQRYLSTRSPGSARRAFITSLSADVVVTTLLSALGLALLAYFHAHSDLLPPGRGLVESGDQLFLRFVMTSLPVGITGLLLAGLLAAGMSSLSSGVNSVSAVVMNDLIPRFRQVQLSARQQLRLVRRLSWVLGLLVVVLSVFVGEVDKQGNILQTTHRTVNLLVAPLFVPFFLAFFVPWATTAGAFVGCIASIVVALLIGFAVIPLNFLWLMPASLVTGVSTGMIVGLLPWSRVRR